MTDVREQVDRPAFLGTLSRACPADPRLLKPEPRAKRHGPVAMALARTIERRVIPGLVIAHAKPKDLFADLAADYRNPVSGGPAALAEQMLAGDTEGALAEIQTLRAGGQLLETIYLQVVAPAAAHLRRLWSDDLCGFAEVTLALWRLQQLLRHFSVEFRSEGARRDTGRRALLAPTPQEKYDLSYAMFCLVLMSEFFRRDGWDAWIEPEPGAAEFARTVREQWFDVAEFIVSGDKQIDALAARIRMIRRESPNRSIGVMVSGQIFIEHPELVLLVGADLTATDARQGALQAERLAGLTHRP